MRKLWLILLLFSLFSVLLVQGAYIPYSSPQFTVTLLSQEPDSVEPGEVVTVKFKVENAGIETSQEVLLKVLPKFPFTIYDDFAEKNLGKLRASSTGADAAIVEFKIKVAEAAVEAQTGLDLQLKMGESIISYTNDEFKINIQTRDAVLDIVSITSEPKQITPGESAKVSILVKNLADSVLKDIKLKLDFESSSLPLAPYQSSSERRIPILESNYQNSLTFQIIADPTATPGLYKIPLNITYNDAQGSNYRLEDVLAITIGEVPKVRAYIKKSTVQKSNAAGKVTIEIANAGTSEIKFLELTLLPSEDYTLISTTNYYYLGNVDSDDTESEEIDLFVNWWRRTLHLPVQLKYYDANNQPFQQRFDLELPLYSTSTLKKFGLVSSNNGGILIILVLLGLGGFFLWRNCRKNPEKCQKVQKFLQGLMFWKKRK